MNGYERAQEDFELKSEVKREPKGSSRMGTE